MHLGTAHRAARAADAPPTVALATQPAKVVDLLVIDAKTKQPLKDVEISFLDGSGKQKSGADGHVLINVSEGPHPEVAVEVGAAHYVREYLMWTSRPLKNDDPPASYSVALEPGMKISGHVVDDAGKPVEGAHVVLFIQKKLPDGPEHVNPRVSAVTGADGVWSYDAAPASPEYISLGAWHYQYANGSAYAMPAVKPISKLYDGSDTYVLERGLPIEGVVLGLDGKPVEGATVRYGGFSGSNTIPPQPTDKNGRFSYAAISGESVVLTARAKGCAPELQEFRMGDQKQDVKIQMSPAKVMRGRVVDSTGKPIPKASISVDTWRGQRAMETFLRTDKDGRFVWSEAPVDGVLCNIGAEGFLQRMNVPLMASDKELTVTLTREVHVHGTVVDAQTQQPIDVINVVHGWLFDNQPKIYWSRASTKPKPTGGKFDYMERSERKAYAVRIEAEGYAPVESRTFKADEGDVALEIKLTRTADRVFSVVRPDDKPAANDTVLLVAAGHFASIVNGESVQQSDGVQFTTDDNGKLLLPAQSGNFTMVIFGSDGYAQIESTDLPQSGSIKLQPWFSVDGKVMIGSKPGSAQRVNVQFTDEFQPFYHRDRSKGQVYQNIEVATDGEGKFSIPRIPPGNISIAPDCLPGMARRIHALLHRSHIGWSPNRARQCI